MSFVRGIRGTSLRRTVMYATMAGVVALGGVAGAFWIGGTASGATGRRQRAVTQAALSKSISLSTVAPVTTATFNFTVSVTRHSGQVVTATGNGQVDFANQSASGTLTFPSDLGLGGVGGPTSSTSTTQAQFVITAGTVYASVPGVTTLLGGKPWISYALNAKMVAKEPSAFNTAARLLADVGGVLGYVKSHGGTVSSLGSRTINGVSANGYQVQVNVAKTLEAFAPIPRRVVRRAVHVTGATVSATVWEDSSGRLVQASSSVNSAVGAKHGLKNVSATLNVGGYGTPVSIVAPPAASTTALSPGALKLIRAFVGSHGNMMHHRASTVWHLRHHHTNA